MFIFDGGELSDEHISRLRIVDSEIGTFEFCTEAETKERLRAYMWRRVEGALNALKSGGAVYLQDGHLLA